MALLAEGGKDGGRLSSGEERQREKECVTFTLSHRTDFLFSVQGKLGGSASLFIRQVFISSWFDIVLADGVSLLCLRVGMYEAEVVSRPK